MAILEMGHAWGKVAGKTEREWDPSRDRTKMGAASGSQPSGTDLLDDRCDWVWYMPHLAWGMDGKHTGCLPMCYGAWDPWCMWYGYGW